MIDRVLNVACDPRDDGETRRNKRLAVGFAVAIMPIGVVWGAFYAAFGEVIAAVFPIAYVPATLANLLAVARSRDLATFGVGQRSIILALPLGLHLALGGFQASSAVLLWAVFTPLTALTFSGPAAGRRWLAAFLTALLVGTLLQWRDRSLLPDWLEDALFFLNIGTIAAIAYGLLERARRLLETERVRSETVLRNVLPPAIAARLREGERTIADAYDAVTVIFADVVGSTPLTERLSPRELVDLLNEHFTAFDELAERHGVEKIRTIGDNWMGVAGAPTPRRDHAHAIARLALAMLEHVSRRRSDGLQCLDFRIGVNSGPVVGGVIGTRKVVFDIWGDPVNTAARMESHGEPGRIQLTRATYELIKDEFQCEPRGEIEVKGKGRLETFFLVGTR